MALFKSKFFPNNLLKNNLNYFSTSKVRSIKEIKVQEENGILTIAGETFPSSRVDKLLSEAKLNKFCPECSLGLNIKHTDVLIISQYLRSDGCMLPRRVTGLCKKQQRKISSLVTMAKKAGLMPNLAPPNSNRDPKKRYQWKKFNTYFDENTIKCNS